MSKINFAGKQSIVHGKTFDKEVAYSIAKIEYSKLYLNCNIISWIARADKPHRCDTEGCPLFRLYLRDRFWKIGMKAMIYYESKKALEKYLPADIVTYILENFFHDNIIKFNLKKLEI
jgi:hypothetical protein